MTDSFRIERDTMGEMQVPSSALYGPETARAVHNFPVSGKRFPRSFIRALGIVKSAAATINGRMGHLPAALAASIEAAAEQVVVDGQYRLQPGSHVTILHGKAAEEAAAQSAQQIAIP